MSDLIVAGRPRAVQYLRMSTEHQRYSLENQSLRIGAYAAENGYDIVETYVDSGCSGLTLKERSALNQLLRDVTDPERTFSTILVLDVSRWGRFQNPDQHAAYEFLCREMGVRVEYAAEGFINDDSLTASIMKHIKRVMAGEYSRELSEKISFSQVRGAGRGQKQGGSITFGLRRLLVDADGNPKQELEFRERKSISSDRVLVVPGPVEEQAIVRHIFDLFLGGAPITSLSRHLNHMGVAGLHGRPWSIQMVKSVLTNEIYTGVYVFNRTSQKLKTPRVQNPESLWVRVPVFDAIVTRDRFDAVQEKLAHPRSGSSNSYNSQLMLDGLRRLLAQKGRLSTKLINACPYLPHISTYRTYFGTLGNLYRLIGYDPAPLSGSPRRPARGIAYKKTELLAQLKRALEEHKYLTYDLLDRCQYTACATTYANAFGSLAKAYKAAGYAPEVNRPPGACHDKAKALADLKQLFDRRGFVSAALVQADPSTPSEQWYRRHCGSFREACLQAGITDNCRPKARSHRALREYLYRPEGGHRALGSQLSDFTDEHVFQIVRRLYAENGYLNTALIFSAPEMPSPDRLRRRYATLKNLYAAAGLPADVSSFQKRGVRYAQG